MTDYEWLAGLEAIQQKLRLAEDDCITRLEHHCRDGKLENASGLVQLWKASGQELRVIQGAVVYAAEYGREEVVKYLVEEGVPATSASVQAAIRAKSIVCLELLLEHGWRIDAALQPAYPSVLAFAVGDERLVQWLLDRRADPNARCELDCTPLSIAVARGSRREIDMMFRYGGDATKEHLIHQAVKREPFDVSLVDMLLDKGAPISAVLYASDEQTEVEYQTSALGLGTPLHSAVASGNIETVQHLIRRGACRHTVDTKGRSPLRLALERGASAEIVSELQRTCGTAMARL